LVCQNFHFKDEDLLAGLLQAGLPEEIAKNYAEMGAATRSGEMAVEYNANRPHVFGKIKLEVFATMFAAIYAQS
jgi:hypothetical protein